MISQRTKAGLQAAKARGKKLGTPTASVLGRDANREAASVRDKALESRHDRAVAPVHSGCCFRDRASRPRQALVADHRTRSCSSWHRDREVIAVRAEPQDEVASFT